MLELLRDGQLSLGPLSSRSSPADMLAVGKDCRERVLPLFWLDPLSPLLGRVGGKRFLCVCWNKRMLLNNVANLNRGK